MNSLWSREDAVKASIIEEFAEEDRARADAIADAAVRASAARKRQDGPTWQIIAQIVSSAFLALGAWLLQGIKAQSEANGLAIVAIQTELSQRVQRADADHARFQTRDEELFEAIRALNDKLDQERIERIRGERR